jgi:steroid 5-alpha reductase family enzyme
MDNVFLMAAVVIACQMVFLWLLSSPLRNVSIVDIGWGMGFVFVAWLAAPELGGPPTIFYSLVTVWGVRLAWHLWLRNHGKPEDYRYVAMREKHGSSFVWSSLLRVFALQGVIMWLIALPIMVAGAEAISEPCWILTGCGCALWLVGMFFEVVGDWQLARFKSNADNQGKVMDTGLWKYTRHPNYFGEFVLWWGHWVVCLGLTDPTKTWWTILSPALISFLLLKISGVALLEQAMRNRSPEYEFYIHRTSTFFPRRPRPQTSVNDSSLS